MPAPAPIRTPDQRLRVFVSSTLKELEAERRAARAAIERLHLAPVMFELGARPHPPRSLYRSYLQQSDIFIGIYGERYGWVAPDEEVSGLEDEYRLSGSLPLLVYIREPSPAREPRLKELLADIRDDDRTSYKSFSSAEELEELIVADLATLLADRFVATGPSGTGAGDTAARPATRYPAPFTALIGRDDEVRAIHALLADPSVRLVTLVGPGGIGKSRLAIELAGQLAAEGKDVGFAALESLTQASGVLSAIARGIGVRDTGEMPLEDAVLAAIADRDYLLVIDNMEHLLDATDVVLRLVTHTPRLTVLVTSRAPLRLRAERTFEVRPLTVPDVAARPAAVRDDADEAAAVRLFVERAAAVRPGFRLTDDNRADVIAICRALDGVPLAIELAAARIRAYTPHELVTRLDSALSMLVGGARDLPARQRAIRSTIEWSVRLLDAPARDALALLSVFAGAFSREAATAVIDDPSAEESLEALLDTSLVQVRENRGVRVFTLLVLVRAYAAEVGDPDAVAAARERWIDHYRRVARDAEAGVRGDDELLWLRALDAESENIAAVMRWLLDHRRLDDAAETAWSLYLPLWLNGLLGVVQGWMSELLAIADREHLPLAPRTEAIALYYANAISFWRNPETDVAPGLKRSAELLDGVGEAAGASLARVSLGLALLARPEGPDVAGASDALSAAIAGYRSADDPWGLAMALVTRGRLDLAMGDIESAARNFDEAPVVAARQQERLAIVISQHHRGWGRLLRGEIDGAEADFSEGLDVSIVMNHDEGIAYGLEGLLGVAAARGDARRAGRLMGAAQTLRRRTGIVNLAGFALYDPAVAALRQAGGSEEFDAGAAEGARMRISEVLDDGR
jgi:predicted ATPase